MKQPFTEVAKYLAKNKIKFYPAGRFLRYSHGKKVERGILDHLALVATAWCYHLTEHHTLVVSKDDKDAFKELFRRSATINNGKVFSTDRNDNPDAKYVDVSKCVRTGKNEYHIEIQSPSGGWYIYVIVASEDFTDLEKTSSGPLLKKTKKQLLAGQFF